MKRSPFESASFAVQEWLDRGAGSGSVKRDTKVRIENGCAWDIDLYDDTLPIKAVRLVLPPDFPASTCELYVSRDYFLKLPHIEADGPGRLDQRSKKCRLADPGLPRKNHACTGAGYGILQKSLTDRHLR